MKGQIQGAQFIAVLGITTIGSILLLYIGISTEILVMILGF